MIRVTSVGGLEPYLTCKMIGRIHVMFVVEMESQDMRKYALIVMEKDLFARGVITVRVQEK